MQTSHVNFGLNWFNKKKPKAPQQPSTSQPEPSRLVAESPTINISALNRPLKNWEHIASTWAMSLEVNESMTLGKDPKDPHATFHRSVMGETKDWNNFQIAPKDHAYLRHRAEGWTIEGYKPDQYPTYVLRAGKLHEVTGRMKLEGGDRIILGTPDSNGFIIQMGQL
jgi:hypothetical protein